MYPSICKVRSLATTFGRDPMLFSGYQEVKNFEHFGWNSDAEMETLLVVPGTWLALKNIGMQSLEEVSTPFCCILSKFILFLLYFIEKLMIQILFCGMKTINLLQLLYYDIYY